MQKACMLDYIQKDNIIHFKISVSNLEWRSRKWQDIFFHFCDTEAHTKEMENLKCNFISSFVLK
jgi:hypothetical protein